MGDTEVMASGKTLNCRDAKLFRAWNHFLGDWHWGFCCHQDGLGRIAFWEFATVGFGGIFTGEKRILGEFVPVVTFGGLNVAVVVVRGVSPCNFFVCNFRDIILVKCVVVGPFWGSVVW
jgi:hypothetical protein